MVKFSLDGVDDSAYFFHDLEREERRFPGCPMDESSVMAWGAVGYENKIVSGIIPGTMTATDSVEMIKRRLASSGTPPPT